jgi:hypothetical protein
MKVGVFEIEEWEKEYFTKVFGAELDRAYSRRFTREVDGCFSRCERYLTALYLDFCDEDCKQ